MSGFSDSVEEVKMAFDKGERACELSQLCDRFLSAHSSGGFDITCFHFGPRGGTPNIFLD